MTLTNKFTTCEICGTDNWTTAYSGAIRDGAFGNLQEDAEVAHCNGCGALRLAESACKDESFYEGTDYREHLDQGSEIDAYFKGHDHLQIHALNALKPHPLRGLTIADIGCGAGSFLDHVRGLSANTIAVEPASHFRDHLIGQGYDSYAYATEAVKSHGGAVDLATSFQVIEHVNNPREFLEDIHGLMKEDGIVLISTPNREDILLDLLPEDFAKFFYRVVHRWYFDAKSLEKCAKLAGFDVVETHFVQRYGMANMIHWARDHRPRGDTTLPGIDSLADGLWKSYLEEKGKADTLFMTLTPSS